MTDVKELAKQKIQKLVDRYHKLTPQELKMNEETTKAKFIRPLFEALGWDFETDVLLEDKISNGRVDYNFQINGHSKLFIEAKPLRADIDDINYAKQATNYAWLKNVNWAVLTDFEGIRLFYPAERGQAKSCLRMNISDYLMLFDDLWILSKESFQNNLIDRQAEKWGAKPEQVKVSEQLAEDMKNWRLNLSKNFKLLNKHVRDSDIDEGIQKILDRFIFIRSCEDRGLENDSLISKYRIWQQEGRKGNFLEHLGKLFKEYQHNYNSGLFDDHPCMTWDIMSDCFDEIIHGLYQSKNGQLYDFSAIDSDVLGGVYEQYLGHLLSKSGDGDDSKKKRKSQGIYYTPSYIVDYIVQNTLGEAVKTKKPEEIRNIKILDPACGSGSFLIKAYNYLENYNTELENSKKADLKTQLGQIQQAFRRRDGIKELTVPQKFEILRNNIYGVDLDKQAVEIAQLNLMLKTLEKKQQLPHLGNIKCGNSLIDDKKVAGKNAFNWNEEFSDVMQDGGFDIIIGNPPYIKEYVNKSVFDGLHANPYYQGKMDLWTLFACKAIDLLKVNGCLSFIAPNNWLTNAGASIFRNKVLSEGEIINFFDFGDYKVFEEAGIQTMVFVFKKKIPRKSYEVLYSKIINKNISSDEIIKSFSTKIKIDGIEVEKTLLNPEILHDGPIAFSSDQQSKILNKIKDCTNFSLEEKEVAQGIVGAPDKCFIVKSISNFTNEERKYLRSFHTSAKRYVVNQPSEYIFYLSDKNFVNKNINDYQNIISHFRPHKKILEQSKIKYGTPNKPYYYLHRERDEKFFMKGAKIVSQARSGYPSFCYTEDEYYGSRALNFIKTDRINLKYLTALLNSRVAYYWLKNKGKKLGDLLQVDKGPLLSIPLIKTSLEIEQMIMRLVDNMLQLNEELQETEKGTSQWNQLKSEIDRIDKEIDQTVYKLYNLTPGEIEIIEND